MLLSWYYICDKCNRVASIAVASKVDKPAFDIIAILVSSCTGLLFAVHCTFSNNSSFCSTNKLLKF